MSGGKREALPMEIRHQAKDLYMARWEIPNIANHLGVNENTIRTWQYKDNWVEKRDMANAAKISEGLSENKVDFVTTSQVILGGILKAAKRALGDDGSFKAKDIQMWTQTLATITKLSRLSLGLATSISEEHGKHITTEIPFSQTALGRLNVKHANDPFKVKEGIDDPIARTENSDPQPDSQ